MRMIYQKIEYILDMKENKVPVYIVENTRFFRQMIEELKDQIDENLEGNFLFFEGEKEVNISKDICLISDIFSLDFKNKKLSNALLKRLKEEISKEEYYLEKLELESKMLTLLEKIVFQMPEQIEMQDSFDYDDFFKMFHIKFEEHYEDYVEKVIDILSLYFSLSVAKCFLFVNLKTFFTEEECRRLYQECFYKKIPIILLENQESCYIMEEEEKIIIDEDLCEIHS